MSKKVSEVMTKQEWTIDKRATISEAANMMKTHDIGFLPVTEENRAIGVITDRDLVIRGYAQKLTADESIERVFTRETICCESSMSVEEAAKLMAEQQIRRLLVVDQDRLVGVLALADLATNDQANHAAGHALSAISSK